MEQFWINKKKNSKVIRISKNRINGFVNIVGIDYMGVHVINEDVVKNDFIPCTEKHYKKFKGQ